jgi:sugar phosphate isomerase/epimerase
MRIGLSTLLFPRSGLEEAVRTCVGLGADWVEVIWDLPHVGPGVTRPDIGRMRRTLEDGGVGVSVHGSFWDLNPSSLYAELRRFTLRRLADGISACAGLGGEIFVVHVGKCPVPEVEWMWERAGEMYERTLAEVARLARRAGVRMAVENAGSAYGPYATLEELPGLVERIENAGICLDIGHAHLVAKRFGRTDSWIGKQVRKIGENIVHVHVHDNLGMRDDHLVPGDGEIDFRPVVRTLRSVGYSGAVVVELFDPKKPVETGRRGLEAAKKLWQ